MLSPFGRVDAGIARVVSRRFLLTERRGYEPGAEPQPLPFAFWERWRALGRHAGTVTVWGTFLPDPDPRPLDPSTYPALVRCGEQFERRRFFSAGLIRPPRASVAEIEAVFVALAVELNDALKQPRPED